MSIELIQGPYDGLIYNGPLDPQIVMVDEQYRPSVYQLEQDGRYLWDQDASEKMRREISEKG